MEKIESQSSYAQEMQNWNLVRAAMHDNQDKDQMLTTMNRLQLSFDIEAYNKILQQ